MILVAHCIIGILVLVLIELEVVKMGSWCPKISCRSSKKSQGPELIKDDDVIAEERRVAGQNGDRDTFMEAHGGLAESAIGSKDLNHVDCIRVHNF